MIMKMNKIKSLLPYLLPAISLIFLIVLITSYPQNLTGFAIFQQQDQNIYLIKGNFKISEEYVTKNCFTEIILKENDKVIESVILNKDFFENLNAKEGLYYVDLDKTGLTTEVPRGDYILGVAIYCNNEIVSETSEKIYFEE